jgi:hypothetical protein
VWLELKIVERLYAEGFRHIIFTGHGRGGALAHTAMYLHNTLPSQPALPQDLVLRSIAFGSPYFVTNYLAKTIPPELQRRFHTFLVSGDSIPALMTLVQQQVLLEPERARKWWTQSMETLNKVVMPSMSSGQPNSPGTASSSSSLSNLSLNPYFAHTLNNGWIESNTKISRSLDNSASYRVKSVTNTVYFPVGQFTFLAPTINESGFHPEESTEQPEKVHAQMEKLRFEAGAFSLHGAERYNKGLTESIVNNWDGIPIVIKRGAVGNASPTSPAAPSVFSMNAMKESLSSMTNSSMSDLWPRKTADISM